MLQLRSLHNKIVPYIHQSRQYSICGPTLTYFRSSKELARDTSTNIRSTCLIRLQHRSLSEAASVTPIPATQVNSPFTGIWHTLSQSSPVAYIQDTLTTIHDYSGLPWWASIVVSTILSRTLITLPLAIYQHKIMARLELLALEMPAIVGELKKEAAVAMKKFNWTEKQTRLVYNRSVRKFKGAHELII